MDIKPYTKHQSKILEYLTDGNSINNVEAITQLNVNGLAGRIQDLKNYHPEYHLIVSHKVKRGVRYVLLGSGCPLEQECSEDEIEEAHEYAKNAKEKKRLNDELERQKNDNHEKNKNFASGHLRIREDGE